ncbi:cilia- and flagella-associated protein 74-like [Thomomys bottae]
MRLGSRGGEGPPAATSSRPMSHLSQGLQLCQPAQEKLNVITKRGTLTLTLLGTGVASMITCSIEGDLLDMGYVVARESVSSSFKLRGDVKETYKTIFGASLVTETPARNLRGTPRPDSAPGACSPVPPGTPQALRAPRTRTGPRLTPTTARQ